MSTYPPVDKVVAALGGRPVLRMLVLTLADLQRVVRSGLPVKCLEAVTRHYPEGERKRVSELVAPRTTRQRRQDSGLLSAPESERLERVARLTALAEYVWETPRDAQEFLMAPHPQLDHEAPLDLAATDLGARRVEDLLWKLEYGLPV